MINGVRVAAKQGLIRHDDVGISFFRKNENQETKVDQIDMDERGNLSEYPKGLLDERGILMAELI